MIGLVRNEWKKVFLPVLLTTVLLAIAMSVLSCTIYQNYTLHYDLEAWEVGTELFSLLYPLFVVVPLCWNLYYERKNNFLLYVMPRVKIKKYLTAKWIAYALGTLCIIVIPYILSAVFAIYVKPPVVPFAENPFSHICSCPVPVEGHRQPFCNDFRICPRFIQQEYFCNPYRAVYVFHFRKFCPGDSPFGEIAAGGSF